MDCKLPNNDGRAEGASWVHGTASEVDLVRKCRAKNEGFEAARRRTFPTVLAQTPPPDTSPILEGMASTTRHEELYLGPYGSPGRAPVCSHARCPPFDPYPNEVAQCHRDPNHGSWGPHGLPSVHGSKNTEHQLQRENQLHGHRLASRSAVVDLGVEDYTRVDLDSEHRTARLPSLSYSPCSGLTPHQNLRRSVAHITSGCLLPIQVPSTSPTLPLSEVGWFRACHQSNGMRKLEGRMEGLRVAVEADGMGKR